MVKPLTSSKLKRLQKVGGARVVSDKPVTKPVKKSSPQTDKALLISKEAEKKAESAVTIALDSLSQIKELVGKIPMQASEKPITGLKFQRDDNGLTTGVTFIREKKVFN